MATNGGAAETQASRSSVETVVRGWRTARGGVRAEQRYQKLLDDATPHVLARWLLLAGVAAVYAVRVLFLITGFYIVTYALGIYLLNLLIAFLSPSIDPSLDLDSDANAEGPTLPTKSDEEYRPFIRRLPEFKFWLKSLQAFLVSFTCTFFAVFDIPVFWPILLVYFFILFFITMQKQIMHMVKYRYLPFSIGKKVYKGKADGAAGK